MFILYFSRVQFWIQFQLCFFNYNVTLQRHIEPKFYHTIKLPTFSSCGTILFMTYNFLSHNTVSFSMSIHRIYSLNKRTNDLLSVWRLVKLFWLHESAKHVNWRCRALLITFLFAQIITSKRWALPKQETRGNLRLCIKRVNSVISHKLR